MMLTVNLARTVRFSPWCFRHQVLLRRDRHVYDGSRSRPARVSER